MARRTRKTDPRLDRLAKILEQNLRVVQSGVCPDCGSKLRPNLAITGWWTCEQRGAVTHRARPQDPSCEYQCFIE